MIAILILLLKLKVFKNLSIKAAIQKTLACTLMVCLQVFESINFCSQNPVPVWLSAKTSMISWGEIVI